METSLLQKPIISISYVKLLVETLSQLKADYKKVFLKASFDEKRLDNPDEYISTQEHVELIQAAIEVSQNSALGIHLGKNTQVGTFQLLGYLCLNSKTLREAFDSFRKFASLLSNMKQHFQVEGDEFTYFYDFPRVNAAYDRVRCDFAMAGTLKLCHLMIGSKDVKPLQVNFTHPQPNYLEEYQNFFCCPVYFGQPHTNFVISNQVMEIPLIQSSSSIYDLLEAQAKNLINKRNQARSIEEKVYEILCETFFKTELNFDKLAKQLKLSTHQLRRALKEKSSSYRIIYDQVRQDFADQLLLDPQLSIQEISYLLKFSEPSAFYRAFKQWKGMTPLQYRLKQKG